MAVDESCTGTREGPGERFINIEPPKRWHNRAFAPSLWERVAALGTEVNTSTSRESNPIAAAAMTWAKAGCSVIPVRADRTKKPLIGQWHEFMEQAAAESTVWIWFNQMPHAGIAVICGQVSGNLEMLELEGRATSGDHISKILDECSKRHVRQLFEDLLTYGYAEWTPSGGLHILYRIEGQPVPGNQKVARRPATQEEVDEELATGKPLEQINKIKVLSETRGEGGYTVVAPSTGHVYHPGDSWSVCAGRIGEITTITWRDREAIVEAIHAALDEMPAPAAPAPRPMASTLLPGRSDRPGDDFTNRATWNEILEPHGWTVSHHSGHTTYWVRPGKDRRDGYSATTGRASDGDRLYVFSSSTVFPTEEPINKFAAYAILEHHGDFAAAARELGRRGYGSTGSGNGKRVDPAAGVGTLRHPVPVEVAAVEAAAAGTGKELVPAAGSAKKTLARKVTASNWPVPRIDTSVFDDMDAGNYDASLAYAHIYQDQFKWAGDTGKWWYFDGQVWRRDNTEKHEDGGRHLLTVLQEHAEDTGQEALAKYAKKAANSATFKLGNFTRCDQRIAMESKEFDSKGNVFAVNNGTYCLDTNTFTPVHDPKQLITKLIPVAYDKDATAPRWNQFLEDVLPDQGMRDYIQRCIGFTLHGSARERALFLLHGKSGTGKSQFIRAMELLFGDHAETASSQAFSAASKQATVTNDLNDLRGKRFVALSELDEDQQMNESLIKRLTGGDTAKSRGLYQENAQWRVTFTLWMATNHLPRLSSDDNAIWKRVKPILFPVVQEDTEHGEVKSIAESIFAEEASGILNWALEGVTLYQRHGLGEPPQIQEAVAAYRRDVDTVAQFIEAAVDDNTVAVDAQATITARNLHSIYSEWCKRNNIRPLGERRFGARLESLGYERRRAAAGITWYGIGTGSHGFLGTIMRQ